MKTICSSNIAQFDVLYFVNYFGIWGQTPLQNFYEHVKAPVKGSGTTCKGVWHHMLESYYERAYRYVEANIDKPVLNKLRNNIPLTEEDWKSLEQIFWGEVGTEDEYKKEIHSEENEAIPLGKFVRSLTGLNPETARQAFSEFLDTGKFTEEQIYFVNCIVEYISQYGTLDQQEMADDEFAGGLSVVDVFSENISEFKKIMAVVNSINLNAMPKAA